MKQLIPDTFAARTILIFVACVAVLQIASLFVFDAVLSTPAPDTEIQRISTRIASIIRALEPEPPGRREVISHALTTPSLEVDWDRMPRAKRNDDPDGAGEAIRTSLVPLIGRDASGAMIVENHRPTFGRASQRQLIMISMRMDQGWVNFALFPTWRQVDARLTSIATNSIISAAVVVIAIYLVRAATRPLQRLAEAAQGLGRGDGPTKLDVRGPREVRFATQAFNEMQEDLAHLVRARTLSLAAISHDLRTPLNRLRFRAERMTDAELKLGVLRDIVEMNSMIDSTLMFLRGIDNAESARLINVGSLLRTIVDDYADRGRDIAIEGLIAINVVGRFLVLKRAFTNLVENALAFGASVRVTIVPSLTQVKVSVYDDGPGIDDVLLEAVFAPFFRAESSRNRETGGVGLGLTIAKNIVEAHGGSIVLTNREGGGLLATVTLPIAARPPIPKVGEAAASPISMTVDR